MINKFNIGDKVKVNTHNDNENYNDFRDKILVITHIAKDREEHPGFDECINEPLYDLEIFDTKIDVPCSLYEYELEEAE